MRYLAAVVLLIALPAIALSSEITFGLDRCVVLNSQIDQSAESNIAFHFTLPEELSGTEIMYAELYFTVPAVELGSDSLYMLRLVPFLTEWSENGITYENCSSIVDSIGVGVFTIQLADTNAFHIDFTQYVKEVVEGNRENFGVIGQADLLGDNNLRLPESLANELLAQARIKVIYQ
jgi:hypothetical protein